MPRQLETAIYSFRLLDHRNHVVARESEICVDDADAITRAKYLAAERAVEVWQDARFVNRWERRKQ